MTLNIHHGEALSGNVDLGRIVALLGSLQPDIVVLQEVDRKFSPRSGYVNQVLELARGLDMTAAFGGSVRSDGRPGDGDGAYGQAVLTSGRILKRRYRRLPGLPFCEPRGVLQTVCDLAGQLISVWNVHLAHVPAVERVAQAIAIRGWLRQKSGPTIIAGDLNALPGSMAYQVLASGLTDTWELLRPGDPGFTFPSHRPDQRIDYILTTPEVIPTSVRVANVGGASDHRALVAELRQCHNQQTSIPDFTWLWHICRRS